MKKILLMLMPFVTVACAGPIQNSSVPMDMEAVQEYQQRVSSAKMNATRVKEDKWELNQSDKRPKIQVVKVYSRPSIYYGYGWGRGY